MSYHGKLQTLKNGTADAEIQLWAYQQLEKEPVELTDAEIYDILWMHFPISDKEKNATMIAVMTHCVKTALRKASEK